MSQPFSPLRRQMLCAAVLPAAVVLLCAIAAVSFTLRSAAETPSREAWAVLAGAVVAAALAMGGGATVADRQARAVEDRLAGLRRTAEHSQAELYRMAERLRRGDGAAGGGSEQKVEVFVNLARRLQSLVHREIQLLDELENEVEDPELLKGLFQVDHLATRIRRHAENLAVLGGAISRRQWSHPVTLTEVLRSSIAEVEQYSRVKLVPPTDSTLRGHAVADIIHLLAELVENASVFSAPDTQVLLRTSQVTAGLAIEVEDRGLGMPVTEQNHLNSLLADPDQVDVARLLSDGRIGLFVVSALSRRHGIAVRLQTNIYGGIQAVIVLPRGLLGDDAQGGVRGGVRGGVQGGAQVAPQVTRQADPQTVPHSGTAAAPAARTAEAPALTLHTATHTEVAHVPRQASPEAPPAPAATAPTAEHADSADPDDRPQLPQRRAQQHLVPQLRDAPAPRHARGRGADTDPEAAHDPGLMAAFQFGIGRAETKGEDSENGDSPPAPGAQDRAHDRPQDAAE